ncbi:MAG: PspC domain-containing protein [Candidatus Cloacimonadota bacterium]|nr:MAG: PspC domain-containing protein [Candidatus Cloacimonadota bacterium]
MTIKYEPEKKVDYKKLYRSVNERMIWGVCGGIAEYFNIDVSLVRIGFVLFATSGGFGVLLYIIMAIVMPNKK